MNDSVQNSIDLIHLSVSPYKPSITVESSWWFLIPLFIVTVVIYLFGKRILRSLKSKWFIGETTIKIETGLISYESKIKRSHENLYVANRIYIELITRKAAIPIDEEFDVINEIYDSWYTLFTAIRNEIKSLPGEFVQNHLMSRELIDLTTKILNEGLRPHLTKYQARFRKWYKEELEVSSNKGKTPQEIQKNFPQFQELIHSMKEVNETLLTYSTELKKLIDGK